VPGKEWDAKEGNERVRNERGKTRDTKGQSRTEKKEKGRGKKEMEVKEQNVFLPLTYVRMYVQNVTNNLIMQAKPLRYQ